MSEEQKPPSPSLDKSPALNNSPDDRTDSAPKHTRAAEGSSHVPRGKGFVSSSLPSASRSSASRSSAKKGAPSPDPKSAVSQSSKSGKPAASGRAAPRADRESADQRSAARKASPRPASDSKESAARPLLKVYGKTCKGHVRKINQDSILINKKVSLFAVADGMGGHTGGEVASASAVAALDKFLSLAAEEEGFSPAVHLPAAFREANTQVFQKSRENNGELMGMGTTLVACLLHGRTAYFANVGDSRAYLFRKPGRLWRITEDHSILNMQMKKGLIQQDKADLFSESNVITRSIGFVSEAEADLFQRDILPGDVFLLCSDGLNEASEADLCEILQNREPSSDLVEELIDKALQAGGHDNISALVIAP